MEQKIWGTTTVTASSEIYSSHTLKIEKGGYCSIHYHKYRSNKFTVISGKLLIAMWYGPHIEKVILSTIFPIFKIPSLVPHMFIALENSETIEEYYPDRNEAVQQEDITRLTEGGKLTGDIFHSVKDNITTLRDLPHTLMMSYIIEHNSN